jgi:protein-tyrosine phosphatase
MVDIHCHVLPKIDDGASSWEVAEQMCAMALQDGITHIVATPHANSRFRYDREILSGLLKELRNRTGGKLNFSLGCDFHMSYENVELLFADSGRFLIDGTKYMLLEPNDFSIPPNYQDLLFRIRSRLGVTPILTHPERHPMLQVHPQQVKHWIEAGCLVQVTANSLTGHWGQRAKTAAMWLLKNAAAHVIATDAHDALRRPPVLSQAREAAAAVVGPAAALRLVDDNPRSVVEGRAISV